MKNQDGFLDESAAEESTSHRSNRLIGIWEDLAHAGLAETVLRLGTHALLVALILFVAWGLRQFYLRAQVMDRTKPAAFAANPTTPVSDTLPTELPPIQSQPALHTGVRRMAYLHTDVPSRPRTEVIQYTVEKGDTLFGIAGKFGLKPETILWSNQYILGDNPHNLQPGQALNILPVDGAYHKWSVGDGLNGVAKFFNVKPEDIINFSGNYLDPAEIGDLSNPNIPAGTWLIIPGGRREFVNWSAPAIPLDNPGVGKVLGPGACESVSAGAIGSGSFIWPTANHIIGGFDYNPDANHYGIDIDGETGDAVMAVDNGVVVYAGWNNWGYGNTVVINHGNSWQTLYAHLDAVYVTCGQSIWQTNVIGALGTTGKSSGSHLHFEMMYSTAKVNPHNYLP